MRDDILKSVGKENFVNFYYHIKARSYSDQELHEQFFVGKKESSSYRSICGAYQIFKNGKEIQVLKDILASKRVSQETKDEAQVILDRELLPFEIRIGKKLSRVKHQAKARLKTFGGIAKKAVEEVRAAML